RDVTGTIQSIPLICGSIMSKKIAEGIQGLVLDVKTGNGAFMKTPTQARDLADHLIRIGTDFGVKTDTVFTSMNQPLGDNAGLWCEMLESINCLRGGGPDDTMAVTYKLGARLLIQAGIADSEEAAISLLQSLIADGQAWNKFLEVADFQGGDIKVFSNPEQQHKPLYARDFLAPATGYIEAMDTYKIGLAIVSLGCGRLKSDDAIDPTGGMEFVHKIGAAVNRGDVLIRCFNSNSDKLDQAVALLDGTISIGTNKVEHQLFL
ncbi:MAG: thymidine phosphorylase, partial [Candidatus Marinimicrobia bacterium]|nr:thymidine phosphorylase [Candidatus Neomarinimicrobiota bacterium]